MQQPNIATNKEADQTENCSEYTILKVHSALESINNFKVKTEM